MRLAIPSDLDPLMEGLSAKAARVRALQLPAPSRESLDHKLRIELTHGSTAIEGNTLTLRETQLLIDEGITPASAKQLRELYETLNHDAAVGRIEGWVAEARPLTIDAICEVHRIVLRQIDDQRAGQYRDARVLVTGAPVQPIRPERIPEEMAHLFAEIDAWPGSAVVLASIAHYEFVKIHPFFDGNGRTGRLLFNWILRAAGYPLTVIPAQERARYIASIDQADLGDPMGFFRLMAECVERSLDQYLELA